MAQGPLVYNALIIPLSASSAPPRPHPGPTPPGGGVTPPPATGGEHPDHTLPGDLPRPSHPIYYPLPPGAPVDPSYGIPETGVPHPDHTLPGDQPKPDHTLPGDQPHPSHPIVLPPGSSGGWLPVYIDNTLPGDLPRPTHPIVLPPDQPAPPESGSGAQIKFKAIWTPDNGWQTIGVVVPGGEHVTPSKQSQPTPQPKK